MLYANEGLGCYSKLGDGSIGSSSKRGNKGEVEVDLMSGLIDLIPRRRSFSYDRLEHIHATPLWEITSWEVSQDIQFGSFILPILSRAFHQNEEDAQ